MNANSHILTCALSTDTIIPPKFHKRSLLFSLVLHRISLNIPHVDVLLHVYAYTTLGPRQRAVQPRGMPVLRPGRRQRRDRGSRVVHPIGQSGPRQSAVQLGSLLQEGRGEGVGDWMREEKVPSRRADRENEGEARSGGVLAEERRLSWHCCAYQICSPTK